MVLRIATAVVIILLSVIISSIFGVFHNQVSFSLSNEYFTNFLFYKFSISDFEIKNDNLNAAIIGVLGSYWMGLILGLIYAILYFLLNTKQNFTLIIHALFINVLVSALGGIIGYIIAHNIVPFQKTDIWIDFGIQYPQEYYEANSIHSGSYLGGFIGIIISVFYLLFKSKNRTHQ